MPSTTPTTLSPTTTTIPDLVAAPSTAQLEVPQDLAIAFTDYLASRDPFDFAMMLRQFLTEVAQSEKVALSDQSDRMSTSQLLDEITSHELQNKLPLTVDRIAAAIHDFTEWPILPAELVDEIRNSAINYPRSVAQWPLPELQRALAGSREGAVHLRERLSQGPREYVSFARLADCLRKRDPQDPLYQRAREMLQVTREPANSEVDQLIDLVIPALDKLATDSLDLYSDDERSRRHVVALKRAGAGVVSYRSLIAGAEPGRSNHDGRELRTNSPSDQAVTMLAAYLLNGTNLTVGSNGIATTLTRAYQSEIRGRFPTPNELVDYAYGLSQRVKTAIDDQNQQIPATSKYGTEFRTAYGSLIRELTTFHALDPVWNVGAVGTEPAPLLLQPAPLLSPK